MAAAGAVVRLAGWLFEVLLDPSRIKLVEQSAVVQQRLAATALGTAGDLSSSDCQVREAADLQPRHGERPDQATEYQPVAQSDVAKFGKSRKRQEQRETHASGAEQDGASSRVAPQDGDAVGGAGRLLYLVRDHTATSHHHHGRRTLPQP